MKTMIALMLLATGCTAADAMAIRPSYVKTGDAFCFKHSDCSAGKLCVAIHPTPQDGHGQCAVPSASPAN